jgi:hypothetical protein
VTGALTAYVGLGDACAAIAEKWRNGSCGAVKESPGGLQSCGKARPIHRPQGQGGQAEGGRRDHGKADLVDDLAEIETAADFSALYGCAWPEGCFARGKAAGQKKLKDNVFWLIVLKEV